VIDAGHLRFARAFLRYCVFAGMLRWRDYNQMMRSIVGHQRRMDGCDGKEAFLTFDKANRIATRGGRHGHVHRQAYRCRWCRFFHIGEGAVKLQRAQKRLRTRLQEQAMEFA
jgi:hypothetical protein